MDRIAYTLPEAARIAGVSRTRIFEAVRKQELTIRKAGRASIVTHDDLVAWIKSLPVKGKPLGAKSFVVAGAVSRRKNSSIGSRQSQLEGPA